MSLSVQQFPGRDTPCRIQDSVALPGLSPLPVQFMVHAWALYQASVLLSAQQVVDCERWTDGQRVRVCRDRSLANVIVERVASFGGACVQW